MERLVSCYLDKVKKIVIKTELSIFKTFIIIVNLQAVTNTHWSLGAFRKGVKTYLFIFYLIENQVIFNKKRYILSDRFYHVIF